MYGKHFDSMYQGSMVGSGAIVFAVMGYVIANYKLDRVVGAQVDLNPQLLAFILGEKQEDVQKAIEMLCSPDPNSRTKDNEGRRLVQLGQFTYKVVNGAKYTAIRNAEERREYNRKKQSEYRSRKRSKPLPGEAGFLNTGEMPPTDDRGVIRECESPASPPRNGQTSHDMTSH